MRAKELCEENTGLRECEREKTAKSQILGRLAGPNQAALVQMEMETFSKLRSRSHELELGHANATTPGASSHLRLRLLYQTENCVATSQTRPFGQFNSV